MWMWMLKDLDVYVCVFVYVDVYGYVDVERC